jgi:anti-sigma factor RsiW
MDADRLIAGLRCSDVLADLSDYLDGGLSEARRAQVEAHVRGCDNCDHFGRRFAETIALLRDRLGASPPLEPALADRLRDYVRRDGT